MAELTETFWVAFIATISAMFGLSLRMCLRSRCDQVDCLCLKVHRAVDLESQEHQEHQQHQQQEPRLDEIYSEKINI